MIDYGQEFLFFLRRNKNFLLGYTFPIILLPVLLNWHPELPADKIFVATGKFDAITSTQARGDYAPEKGAYVLLLMACYWVSECIPLPITSMIPVALLPLLGVSNCDSIAGSYLSSTIIFLIGGCILALSFEYSKLNVRIALMVVSAVGAKIPAILLGIMLVTMFLSMFMNNTSTTAMMIPIANVIVAEFSKTRESTKSTNDEAPTDEAPNDEAPTDEAPNDEAPKDEAMSAEAAKKTRNIKCLFLIGTAFAANIGGTGLQTGSGTNLIAVDELDRKRTEVATNQISVINVEKCEAALEISFASWLGFAALPMILNVFMVWFYLQIHFLGFPSYMKFWRKKTGEEIAMQEKQKEAAKNVNKEMKKQYLDLGSMSFHEIVVAIVFLITISLLIFRHPLFITGWADKPSFPHNSYIHDATPTMLMVYLFFICPRKLEYFKKFWSGGLREGVRDPVMTWDICEKQLPWGPFLLLGGGSAMALSTKATGLNAFVGHFLDTSEFIKGLNKEMILLLAIILVAVVTSVASNTATALILSPVLMALALKKDIHPGFLILAPTISASYAFMFPVSTPPNAIAYEAGGLTQMDIFAPGLPITIISNAILFLCVIFILDPIFGYNKYDKYCRDTSITRSAASMILSSNSESMMGE